MSPKITGEAEHIDTELAVIGGGGAGMAAALAAVENGARDVIVLEKGAPGGNSAISLGIFAAESPVQKRALIAADRDILFRTAMNYSHWRIDPRIVRAFIDRSGDTISWLEKKGLKFDVVALAPGQVPVTWHVPMGHGAALMKTLIQTCRDSGIRIMARTPARKLISGRKGEITGILAESDKQKYKISAKNVIIATGGYGGNKELMKKYYPYYHDNLLLSGLPHMGDGIAMATAIGAATAGLGTLVASGPGIPLKIQMKDRSLGPTAQAPLMAVAQEPGTLWVNKHGKRFVDESVGGNHFESANAVLRQPEVTSYTLIDSAIKRRMIEHGLVIGMLPNEQEQRTRLPVLEKGLQTAEADGWAKQADSWDGIAEWIGARPETLKSTIKEYNAACAKGHDPVFAKEPRYLLALLEPPYYAIRAHVIYVDTIGGLKINEFMEVLDTQDRPIPGLYAAGVVTGGWEGETYCAVLSGSAFGFAINSGRIAGENAARRANAH